MTVYKKLTYLKSFRLNQTQYNHSCLINQLFAPNMFIKLYTSSKACINCGNKPRGQFIQLKQDNIIDRKCLEQINKQLQSEDLDEGIKEYYNYIIALVFKCGICKAIIDKICLNSPSQKQQNLLCKKCSSLPLKKIGKEKQKIICFECQLQITGFNLLSATVIDKLYICRKCFDGQSKGISSQKLKKKPQIPNIFKLEGKQLLKHQKSMPYLPQQKLINKLQQKKQYLTCQLCQQHLSNDKFNQIYQGLHICIICMANHIEEQEKKPLKIKKQKHKKKNNETFGLEDLFCEQWSKPIVQKVKQVNQRKEQVKINQKLVVPQTHKSNIYQLKQCKICFFGQSKMINTKCRHLMMCQKCFMSYKAKNNQNQEVPCPVCTVVGKYQLYIEPIYT